MVFLTLLILPLLVALGFKLFSDETHQVTLKEFLVHVGVQLLIACLSVGLIYWKNTTDYETWNGRIVDKKQVRVSCSHSYQCNCYETCDSKGNCTEHCMTCYDHPYDYDWELYTSNNETIDIQRVDRQGVDMPERWNRAYIGEPTAITHSYDNYVKAAPDSLFAKHGLVEKYRKSLPEHPSRTYDYHYINRVVGNTPDSQEWNRLLMELNADLGFSKQANIIIVNTPVNDSMYFEALSQYWLGGKKNDIVVVVHQEHGIIVWARVMAWVDNDLVKIKIRDELQDKPFKPEVVLPIVRENVVKYFKRKPMHDFEYLASAIKPTTTQWIVSMVIGVLISIALGWYFWKNDVFDEERRHRYYRQYTFFN